MMTISGSFFTFDFNGAPASGIGETQTIDYEINDDNQLIFTQNETMTTNSEGAVATTTIVSTSKWEKQEFYNCI